MLEDFQTVSEGLFSEVRRGFTASSSPLAMVLVGWVYRPSGSFSFPELLVGVPWTHPSLLPLFTRVPGRVILRTSC